MVSKNVVTSSFRSDLFVLHLQYRDTVPSERGGCSALSAPARGGKGAWLPIFERNGVGNSG